MATTQVPARAMSPPSESDARVDVKMEEEHHKPALTPPTSEGTKYNHDDSSSELSDIGPDDMPAKESFRDPTPQVDEEILPDHYYDGGRIPVFRPTMAQFQSFKDFVSKIDKYGMKSGIVKVIPPQEWKDSLPPLDEAVKTIRVKNPITQEFHGTHGTYTQANMEKQRSYNLPQWKALCEESNHQPPAKRGERRRNLEKPAQTRAQRTKPPTSPVVSSTEQKKRGPGRPKANPLSTSIPTKSVEEIAVANVQPPLRPKSPLPKSTNKGKRAKKGKGAQNEQPAPKGRQPKSVSSRRLNNIRDQVEHVDEEAFQDFDYRTHDQDEWTSERVQELETAYWRSLNFNNPMYGADMPGSLFDDSTTSWNVAKLENLLDVLGQAVPGVNTAYLYLGMWKASFAWHLEDVDLYSINYIHFGAPKQWYSISQEDARRFENAMKAVWPTDAKNCDQFLRHKTYLISPQLLQSQYNIKVNRLVHYEGEFVITFPYGYHSGYNLGYNCAESVNFATESWLDFGKVARKCNCEADNVWVDVREIERKLRGEPTPEYYEETDEEDEEEEDEAESGLPTPPGSVKGKAKRGPKRKRTGAAAEKDAKPKKVKKLKIRLKAPAYEPCILCPNDNKHELLLPTDNGQRAHRICGLYTPETYVSEEPDGSSIVRDIAFIDKARLELKCNYCRSKKGSVFQCSSKKCTKAYHATCAMPAGIQIDIAPTSVYGEDGTEYIDTGYDFRCRIHRSKRSKNADSCTLENNDFIYSKAKRLSGGDAVQAQFYQGDLFAGNVIENRKDEQNVLLEIMPAGDRVEVDWKWLLFFDPINSQLPIPSENAKPLPADMLRRPRTTAEDPAAKVDGPKVNDPFCDPNTIYKWSEFESCRPFTNEHQEKVDLAKADQLWYFLGEISTDAKQYYTHDLRKRVHNPKSSFLDLEKGKQLAQSFKAVHGQKTFVAAPGTINQHAINAARANNPQVSKAPKERPYHGKYAIKDPMPTPRYRPPYAFNVDHQALQNQKAFQERASLDALQRNRPNLYPYDRCNASPGAYPPRPSPISSVPMASHQLPKTASDPPLHYQPHPQSDFSFNAEKLLRKINMSSGTSQSNPQSQHQGLTDHQTQPQNPRPPAPVANMMGTPSHEHPQDLCQWDEGQRQSAGANGLTPPLSATPKPVSGGIIRSLTPSNEVRILPAKGVSRLGLDSKYTYLHEAEKARPSVYQSPYERTGGFTDAYLPLSTAEHRPRPPARSISEAYLMTRTPSEQGTVTARMSEDKAKFLQQRMASNQRPQSVAGPAQEANRGFSHHRAHHSQPSHLPMAAFSRPSTYHGYPSSPSYTDGHPPQSPSGQYPNRSFHPPPFHSPTYQPHSPFTQQQMSYSKQPSYTQSHSVQKPSGLSYQSPHEFQRQMMHEAQRPPPQDVAFQQFSQQLKHAASEQVSPGSSSPPWYYGNNNSHNRAGSGGSLDRGPGHAGSPLRHEFGSIGQEMLPQMPLKFTDG